MPIARLKIDGASLAASTWAAIASYAILKALDAAMGLRVDEEAEVRGLDVSLHEESGYNL